jgi:putative transcriptional regulator
MLYCSKYPEGGETMAGKSKYTFDSKIHVYRATRRMTQQELADLVGVSRQTINAIEKGEYNPTINLCRSICRVLGKTLDELFWEE